MNAADIKTAMAGGGTGGHLFPALAVAEELGKMGVKTIEFFGTARGPEARIVPQRGYKLHRIWIKGYPRKLKPETLLLPVKLAVSVLQSLIALTKLWPQCLVATGGYVCLPVMIAGKLLGIPIIIHEQNSYPGITTRIGAVWAKTVFYSFPGSERYFRGRGEAVLSGNPVQENIGSLNKAKAREKLGLHPQRKTLLVFGGSQGAAALNRAVSEVLTRLSENYNVIWGTGKGNLPETVPDNTIVREFFDDMNTVYSASDLAVCRAGATTLAELAAAGLPAILVPFPYAAEDHQRLNAEPLAAEGASVLILEKEFNGSVLLEQTERLFAQAEVLTEISRKIKSFHHPGSAKVIAERVIKIAMRER